MGFLILAGAVVYVVAEWFVASWLASIIGWPGVLLSVAVLVILGAAVMRRAGFAAARSLRPVQADGVTVMPGQVSTEQVGREVGDASLLFVAGAMIAIPGIITSFLGLLLLIPPLRGLVRRTISRSVRLAREGGRDRLRPAHHHRHRHGRARGPGAAGARRDPAGRDRPRRRPAQPLSTIKGPPP